MESLIYLLIGYNERNENKETKIKKQKGKHKKKFFENYKNKN